MNAYGNVLYCCQKPDEVVGNIFDEDILDKKEAYKTDMSKCEVPCRMTGNNLAHDEVVKGIKGHYEFL